jgi:transketolase
MGWHRYVGDRGEVVALDHFGASAPAAELFAAYGLTAEAVATRAAALVRQLATAET